LQRALPGNSNNRCRLATGAGTLAGMNDDSNDYDVVIIGGGAAGLSAALVLTRARRRVAVLDTGQPRNAPAAHMHGFLGSDGLPPNELLAAGRAEVTGYGGHLVSASVATVTSCHQADQGRGCFEVRLDDGSSLRTRRVLVATGLRDEVPHIVGVRERWGRDLLHCPYCHGYEVRDQPVGVLGGTPEAVAHAHIVRQWSDDVVFFTNATRLTEQQREQLVARAIRIVDDPVARLVVEVDHLTGVELGTGQVVPRAAVFVRPQFVPNDTLLTELGCARSENGWVAVDATGRTSALGVWAAGNVVNPRAQVITAAGEGSAAAIAINNDLVDEDVAVAVADVRLAMPLS
jgi:thioredoxin reductase